MYWAHPSEPLSCLLIIVVIYAQRANSKLFGKRLVDLKERGLSNPHDQSAAEDLFSIRVVYSRMVLFIWKLPTVFVRKVRLKYDLFNSASQCKREEGCSSIVSYIKANKNIAALSRVYFYWRSIIFKLKVKRSKF